MDSIRRALISVYDKSEVVEFANALSYHEVEILSTGGTATLLEGEGVSVVPVSKYTGQEEILGGRIKTIHSKIFGGILHRRTEEPDVPEANIPTIDLVAVNLYPFQETVTQPDVTLAHALENIDIGGVALLRAAAKNFQRVIVLSDPSDYEEVARCLELTGNVPEDTRRRFAVKAFQHTSEYDEAIRQYLATGGKTITPVKAEEEKLALPISLPLHLERTMDLRYGENPHQQAALYRARQTDGLSLLDSEQLQGRELSYNNLLDLSSAAGMVLEFSEPATVVVKHNNPCGVASGDKVSSVLASALDADKMSAFGGVVVLNRPLDAEGAEILSGRFIEVLAAPNFAPKALDVLRGKKDLRVLRWPELADEAKEQSTLDLRSVSGGILVQQADRFRLNLVSCQIPSRQKPSSRELELLTFAWRVVKHIKSNAILLAGHASETEDLMVTLGVGAGQMSRVDAVKLAVWKAQDASHGYKLTGSVLASDAFFPFRDGIDTAGEAGVKAIVQPGGSKRDEEVINAADEAGIAMILTGMRHFRH